MRLCEHCGMDIEIINPSGYCNHLYYPDYCEICKKREKEKQTPKPIESAKEINKIEDGVRLTMDKTNYEVTIKDAETGEIIYQNKSKGGIVCSVEKILKIDKVKSEIETQYQLLGWGKLPIIMHAMQMIEERIKYKLKEAGKENIIASVMASLGDLEKELLNK